MSDDTTSSRSAAQGAASPEERERVRVAEERATVSTREKERTEIPVRLRTHEHEVPVSESLRRERVDVRRVPVDRIVEAPPETRMEGDTTIVPVVEEVMVRRYRVIEEIHLSVHAETVEHSDTVTLRRQEAILDEDAAAPPPDGR